MATYSQVYDLRYGSTAFRRRVVVALARAAQDVLNDAQATAARRAWARTTLRDTDAMAERFMWGVVANPTVQGLGEASTDADIQFTVNSLIDALGVE